MFAGPNGALQQLQQLEAAFQVQTSFRFFSASALISYEGAASSSDDARVQVGGHMLGLCMLRTGGLARGWGWAAGRPRQGPAGDSWRYIPLTKGYAVGGWRYAPRLVCEGVLPDRVRVVPCVCRVCRLLLGFAVQL